MKKKIIAAILVLTMMMLPLVACGDEGGGSGTQAPGGDTQGGDVTTAEPAFDYSNIVTKSYGKSNEKGIVYLIFNGDEATINILNEGKSETVTGKFSFTSDTFTIGERAFTFKYASSFFNLTDTKDNAKYALAAADADTLTLYATSFALFTGKWSGDGMSISANEDGTLAFEVGGSTMNAEYTYKDYDVNLTQASDGTVEAGNLAEGAIVTSSGRQSDSYMEEFAVDGSMTTRFSSAYSGVANADGAWVTLDLGTAKTFSCVNIYWETACGKDYEIQVSDDNVNWLSVFTMTGNTKTGITSDKVVVHEFAATTARYVRMQGVLRNTSYGYSMYEIEVLSAPLTSVDFTFAADGDNIKVTYNNNVYTLSIVQ